MPAKAEAMTGEATLRAAIEQWQAVGALGRWPGTERPAFGFIHGNWALDNCRIEDGQNFCGVNDEITILQQEGCYADFTFPAWQCIAQPVQTNSIYYAVGYRPVTDVDVWAFRK